MRFRIGLVAVAAVGFVLAAAGAASADIMSFDRPAKSSLPAQDVSSRAVPTSPPPAAATPQPATPEPSAAPGPAAQAVAANTAPAEAPPNLTPQPVPAPEPRVVRSQRPVARSADQAASDAQLRPATIFAQITLFLKEMVADCKIAVGVGTGGPVVMLAVLAVAMFVAARWAPMLLPLGSDRVPKFLYVRDVIAPG